MCGIFGLIGPEVSPHALGLKILRHRGPDDMGCLAWDGLHMPQRCLSPEAYQGPESLRIWFEHLRLSILDLSKAGWQPMQTLDGRYIIIYNGEVYNYRELRKELEAHGVHFQSQTDTEVVLYAYARWGPKALQRFVGMFAFAILDVDAREVFLARDFFGIKPLYYMNYEQGLAFASEIKALLALPGVRARAHPQRVYDYLRYGLTDHEPETMFQGIYHVPPAHYMVIPVDAPQKATLHRYWDPLPQTRLDLPFEEAATRLRELFLESVRLHLRSDVPLGTALSGGIDSSAIVSAIRYLEPRAEIHTFSFVADEDAHIREEPWIDIVTQHVGAHVHKVRPRPEDLPRDLDDLVWAQDEPFGSTSIYAQYRVFRLAKKQGIKVMLDGQGADEMLAGYSIYYVARAVSLWRQRRYGELVHFLERIRRVPASWGLRFFLPRLAAFLLPPELQRWPRKLLGEEPMPAWLNADWFRQRGVQPYSLHPARDTKEVLRAMLLRDLQRISLPRLLRYEDRNSMWHSIESRVPFLTPQLVHFVYSLPESYLISSDGTTKAIFRAAMRGLVPEPILARRDKVGFATPERVWLQALQPWVAKTLKSAEDMMLPVLNLAAAREQWQAMLRGSRLFRWTFWRWLNLIRWSERFAVDYA
ncbi:MAG: asparagine synthase (glutamine-hydrolyzing) [Gammaproteobacteria bacterium]|nr:asparagine synthase (glutamine-hydrolyzing) [Gammaproteobacteria bacterium]